jgi:catechol 2,3-dioxygenase-like lactoylglutathione lyase family enzyme
VFFGLSHVDVPVRDLARARALYERTLGFQVVQEGEGYVDLDAATARVRLVESARPERPASLRVEAGDVEAGVRALEQAGAIVLYAASRTDRLTIEGSVRDIDGNTITVWRALSEDEYGFVPELPKEKGWSPEAERLLQSLLKSVPALFRGLARRKVVKEAEARAGRDGHIDRDLAIRAFISAQSPPNRKRLYEPLRAHGIDPAAYRDEFES